MLAHPRARRAAGLYPARRRGARRVPLRGRGGRGRRGGAERRGAAAGGTRGPRLRAAALRRAGSDPELQGPHRGESRPARCERGRVQAPGDGAEWGMMGAHAALPKGLLEDPSLVLRGQE